MRGTSTTPAAGTPRNRLGVDGMYCRRHIDLLRVAGALCPAYGDAASRHTAPPRTAL
ncbi:putative leader peptide [Streptomyces sp. NPDC051217]|uniref:putative leader peptide n=1 Tax=Streptomyces sp. NPDC051217 TaxID=3365644 RepID=UPI0037961EE4